ncbi:retroviral-like aspartic protease family protein [Luteibacter aegosomaticola]|uniref:retropepsin-like aspartic protease n=1 Tax=Luteibacter aegosomaticola TaxID=2911538 RepID=UPI001FFC0C95|nr:retropepsin-like aspartic protease [Luteibacter aegosomaticola]UPG89927.1 retroviral-like aspartic protease family protein [Luteibacter aegosomaticola]
MTSPIHFYWPAALLLLVPSLSVAQWERPSSVGASESAPVLYVDSGSNSPIRAAALNGDIDKLSITAASTTSGYGDVGKALIARAHGDFTGSARLAADCVDHAMAAGGGGASIALVCAEIGASNVLMRGDQKGWAQATIDSWNRLAPALRAATGQTHLSTSELDIARAVLSGAPETKTSIQWRPTRQPLRFLPDPAKITAPGERLFVEVEVNGKVQHWMLDTGVQTSALSRADAASLGLPVTEAHIRARDPSGRSVSTVGLVDVDQLNVAGLEVKHARMLVVPGDVSLLGMDLLARMGSVTRISSKAVSFDASPGRCDSPLTYKLDFTGLQDDSGVLMSPSIAGEQRLASLDLGNNSALALASSDLSWRKGSTPVQVRVTKVTGESTMEVLQGKVDVSANGTTATVPLSIVDPDGSSPPWTVGSGILHQFDVVLDHSRHTACLWPAAK